MVVPASLLDTENSCSPPLGPLGDVCALRVREKSRRLCAALVGIHFCCLLTAKARRGEGPGPLQPPGDCVALWAMWSSGLLSLQLQPCCCPWPCTRADDPAVISPASASPSHAAPLLSPQQHFPSQRPCLVWNPKPGAMTLLTPSYPAAIQPHAYISTRAMLFAQPPLVFRPRAGGALFYQADTGPAGESQRVLAGRTVLCFPSPCPAAAPWALLDSVASPCPSPSPAGVHSWAVCTFPTLLAPFPQPVPSTPAQLPAAPQRLGESLGLIVLAG